MASRRCPSCGSENPADYRFCEECGAELAPLEAAVRKAEGAAPATTPADVVSPAGLPAADAAAQLRKPEEEGASPVEASAPSIPADVPCPACGHPNPAGYRFCEECGAELTTPATERASQPATSLPPVAAPVVVPPVPVAPAALETAGPHPTDATALACPACYHSNPTGYRFCEECGHSLTEPEPVLEAQPEQQPGPEPVVTRVAAKRSRDEAPRHPVRLVLAGVAAAAAVAAAVGAAIVLIPRDHGGPTELASPRDVMALVDTADFDLAPNAGLTVEQGEGRFTFEDHTWRAQLTHADGLIETQGVGERVGHFEGSAGSTGFVHTGSQNDAAWAEGILGRTPGLVHDGSTWRIDDVSAFSTVIGHTVDGGSWGLDQAGTPFLFRDTQTRFVYYRTGEGYAWALDEYRNSIFLMVPTGDRLGTAGVVVPDGSRFRFREGPDPAPQAVVDAALDALRSGSGIELALEGPPIQVTSPSGVVDAAFDSPSSGSGIELALEGPPIQAIRSSALVDASAADSFRAYFASGDGGDLSYGNQRLQTGWAMTAHSDEVLPNPPVAPGAPFTGPEPVTIGADIRFDQGFQTIFGEYNCFQPGPGPVPIGQSAPAGSGGPATRQAPPIEVAGGIPTTAQQVDLYRLAVAWMPGVTLAGEEKCGWITRVMATVLPYDVNHQPTLDLQQAARVEIVYTIFYDMDGGRFGIEAHPGDNEGFVIGLVRSERRNGRCGLTEVPFELVGAMSSAHKDLPEWSWVPGTEGIFSKSHDSILAGSFGGPCPDAPPTWGQQAVAPAPQMSSSTGYAVYASENKHANYFDPEECTSMIGFAEECGNKTERPPYDLSSWVEVFIASQGEMDDRPCNDGRWNGGATLPPANETFGSGTSYVCGLRDDGWGRINSVGQVSIREYGMGPGFWQVPAAAVAQATVPNVLGLSVSEAQRVIEEAGFLAQFSVERPQVTDPADVGAVIDQDPAAGTVATPGSFVELVVGGEVAQVRVPDVMGSTRTAAEGAIHNAGLVPAYSGQEAVDPNSPLVDRVALQTPAAGSLVAPGTTVNFRIGVADQAIVPDLIGRTESAAMVALGQVGLDLHNVGTIEVEPDSGLNGRVAWQDPSPGTAVPLGAIVEVRIGAAGDMVTVPYLEGLDLPTAQATAASNGVVLHVSQYVNEESDPYWNNRVLLQSPSGGTEVRRGSTVSVVVEDSSSTANPDTDAIIAVLTWTGAEDFDLAITEPGGFTIDRVHTSSSHGYFDGNDEGSCSSSGSFEERIVWPGNRAPSGDYIAEITPWCQGGYVEWTLTIDVSYDGSHARTVYEYGDNGTTSTTFHFVY
jgi:beta-lactam-binding protein with PASTA domain